MKSRKSGSVAIYHKRGEGRVEKEGRRKTWDRRNPENPACIWPLCQEAMAVVLYIQQHIQVKYMQTSNRNTQ